MPLSLQPVSVDARRDADGNGVLVFADGRLVAVLVHLTDPAHDEHTGAWFLEAGFGRCSDAVLPPIFADLDEAHRWIGDRLGGKGR